MNIYTQQAAAKELGRQMVLLAEKRLKLPAEYDILMYKYVMREYDTRSYLKIN